MTDFFSWTDGEEEIFFAPSSRSIDENGFQVPTIVAVEDEEEDWPEATFAQFETYEHILVTDAEADREYASYLQTEVFDLDNCAFYDLSPPKLSNNSKKRVSPAKEIHHKRTKHSENKANWKARPDLVEVLGSSAGSALGSLGQHSTGLVSPGLGAGLGLDAPHMLMSNVGGDLDPAVHISFASDDLVPSMPNHSASTSGSSSQSKQSQNGFGATMTRRGTAGAQGTSQANGFGYNNSGNKKSAGASDWSDEEISLFQEGLVLYGAGNWRQIAALVSTRTTNQVKTFGTRYLQQNGNMLPTVSAARMEELRSTHSSSNTHCSMESVATTKSPRLKRGSSAFNSLSPSTTYNHDKSKTTPSKHNNKTAIEFHSPDSHSSIQTRRSQAAHAAGNFNSTYGMTTSTTGSSLSKSQTFSQLTSPSVNSIYHLSHSTSAVGVVTSTSAKTPAKVPAAYHSHPSAAFKKGEDGTWIVLRKTDGDEDEDIQIEDEEIDIDGNGDSDVEDMLLAAVVAADEVMEEELEQKKRKRRSVDEKQMGLNSADLIGGIIQDDSRSVLDSQFSAPSSNKRPDPSAPSFNQYRQKQSHIPLYESIDLGPDDSLGSYSDADSSVLGHSTSNISLGMDSSTHIGFDQDKPPMTPHRMQTDAMLLAQTPSQLAASVAQALRALGLEGEPWLEDVEIPPTKVLEMQEDQLLDLEIQANSEFFEGNSVKTPERYLRIRNHILRSWLMNKQRYVTKTSVRRGLRDCGDVNAIGRVHQFLELVGAINFGLEAPASCRKQGQLEPISVLMLSKGGLSQYLSTSQQLAAVTPQKNNNLKQQHNLNSYDESRNIRSSFDPSYELLKVPSNVNLPQVVISSNALMVMDLHAHLHRRDGFGWVAGTFDADRNAVTLRCALPYTGPQSGPSSAFQAVPQWEKSILNWIESSAMSASIRAETGLPLEILGYYTTHKLNTALSLTQFTHYKNRFCKGAGKSKPFIGIFAIPYDRIPDSTTFSCVMYPLTNTTGGAPVKTLYSIKRHVLCERKLPHEQFAQLFAAYHENEIGVNLLDRDENDQHRTLLERCLVSLSSSVFVSEREKNALWENMRTLASEGVSAKLTSIINTKEAVWAFPSNSAPSNSTSSTSSLAGSAFMGGQLHFDDSDSMSMDSMTADHTQMDESYLSQVLDSPITSSTSTVGFGRDAQSNAFYQQQPLMQSSPYQQSIHSAPGTYSQHQVGIPSHKQIGSYSVPQTPTKLNNHHTSPRTGNNGRMNQYNSSASMLPQDTFIDVGSPPKPIAFEGFGPINSVNQSAFTVDDSNEALHL